MTRSEEFPATDAADWMRCLERCANYDFYHLPQYHRIAEEAGEGTARLFFREDGDHAIALPLLIRPLAGPLATEGRTETDATSVYGYAGPIATSDAIPERVLADFRADLIRRLQRLGVVSVFTRLHPFFSRLSVLDGLGDCTVLGRTVSIDLTLPEVEQRRLIRRSHREGANRLRKLGVVCVEDREGKHFDDFIRLYRETMQRVGAAGSYFFPTTYFEHLRDALGERLRCFVCVLENRVLCAGLYAACNGIVQYHLGATAGDALPLAPMKLLVDEVRLWAVSQGHRVFHLGGGTTSSPDDSLLYFKRGFSDRVHDFRVWRWILSPDRYEQLCRDKADWNLRHGHTVTADHFFPAYRAPTRDGSLECAKVASASPAVIVEDDA
jgi:hypothetical protein